MIEVPLTQGKVALIDDEDAPRILAHKWAACVDPRRKREVWYAVRRERIKNTKNRKIIIYLHREITNAPSHLEVDHINGDGLDNRKSNLRLATHDENLRNSYRPIGASGYRGIHWIKNRRKYQAVIVFEGKKRHLGYYDCPKRAAIAYDSAARELHGEFAALNFPNGSGD